MSLDIYFEKENYCPHCGQFLNGEEVYLKNITHNLSKMAREAGFGVLWEYPEESGIRKVKQLIPYIEHGIKELESNPEKYKKFSASNGLGTYEQFIPWLKELLENMYINEDCNIKIWK